MSIIKPREGLWLNDSAEDVLGYQWDETRGKWLSNETMVVQCAYQSTAGAAHNLYFERMQMSGSNGWRPMRSATIIGVSAMSESSSSNLIVGVDGGGTTYTLGTYSSNEIQDMALDFDIDDTHRYFVQNDGAATKDIVAIYYKWRL